GDRHQLRHLAGDLRLAAVIPDLQFFLHPADLHLHHRGALRAPGARHLSRRRRGQLGARRARARAGAHCRRAHAGDAAALRVHAALVWPRHARCGRRRRGERDPREPRARRGGDADARRRRQAHRLVAAGGRARRRRHDGRALGLQPCRARRRRYRHAADRAVVFRADPHRRQDARRHRRCRAQDAPPLDSEARALLDTLVEQTAAALDRASLAREMVNARTATETERVRNTLLASVSHDFRTPLSSILGSASSLIDYGDKLGPAAQKDLLGQIKTEAEELDEMVRNLLAITRIDAGALELRRDWIDLREAAERVVNAARRHGARQKIEVRMPDGLPLVRADAALTEQLIGNIVGNAVVHTPPETAVQVEASVAPSNVALRVTDDGPGIAPDVLPTIFDKFVKGGSDAPTGDSNHGTGLGLAIAKGIMEAHGGSIAVESPVANGRGARFTMIFPREAAPP